MPEQFLIFNTSEWWLVPIALLSGLLSWLLYSKKTRPWSSRVNLLLAALRFLTLFLVFSLFLDPVANLITYQEERPLVAVAIDNSTSMLQKHDSAALNTALAAITNELSKKNYRVETYDLYGKNELEETTYTAERSNLNQQLKNIESDYKDQNLAAIVQLTDGIVTHGLIPSRNTFGQPIHTIGVGDTIAPRDIKINTVVANKLVYLGNLFTANALIAVEGFVGEEANVTVRRNGSLVKEEDIVLKEVQQVTFTLDADLAGLYRYTVEVQPLEGESTLENNAYDFYVDIIDGKENILIIAPAPHPDIRALRSVLEKSENYDTHLYIPGLKVAPKDISYDVVIYHDAFKNNRDLRTELGLEEVPTFFLVSERPAPQQLDKLANVKLSEYSNQTDNVTPAAHVAFSKFTIERELLSRLENYPSLTVPFADITLNGPHNILLYQQVGRIKTEKPLLSYYDDGSKKMAVLLGKGIWKWKLQEGAVSGDTELFDLLVSKTVQYLSIRDDKKRFAVVPTERLFEERQPVRFNVEVYNSLYERIGGQPFTINVTDENNEEQSFEFYSNDQVSEFSLGNLPAGTYQFSARTQVENKEEVIQGQFIVKRIQVEAINQQADHQLLRRLSRNTQGAYFHIDQLPDFLSFLADTSYPGIIRSKNEFIPLRKSAWIIALIILLASSEWFLRKYLGSY